MSPLRLFLTHRMKEIEDLSKIAGTMWNERSFFICLSGVRKEYHSDSVESHWQLVNICWYGFGVYIIEFMDYQKKGKKKRKKSILDLFPILGVHIDIFCCM